MTTLTRTLIAVGAVALLAACAIWFAGYQWAGHACTYGGRGEALLDTREGSIAIVADSCRAVSTSGVVREVPLSDWHWNGHALVSATLGVVAIGGAAVTRWRRPQGLRA